MMIRSSYKTRSVHIVNCLLKQRFYTIQNKGARIGTKFESKQDIDDFLDSNKWDGQELLQSSTECDPSKVPTAPPSDEMIYKLLKLSGLSQKGIDMEEIRTTLTNQIQFIDLLQNVPLSEEEQKYDTNYARLLPRDNKPLKYNEILKLIETQKKNKQGSEISGSWNPTSLATISVNNYYILKKGLLKNRN